MVCYWKTSNITEAARRRYTDVVTFLIAMEPHHPPTAFGQLLKMVNGELKKQFSVIKYIYHKAMVDIKSPTPSGYCLPEKFHLAPHFTFLAEG
jgi:hypothetical protein